MAWYGYSGTRLPDDHSCGSAGFEAMLRGFLAGADILMQQPGELDHA
jgi:hypothetical protein